MTTEWGTVSYEARRKRWRAQAGREVDRRHLGYFATRAEAEAACREAHRIWTYQERAGARGATLRAFGRRWLDEQEDRGLRRGIPQDRDRFRCHIATAPFAAWPLEAITARDIQRWVRELAGGEAQGPRGRGQRRSRRTVQNVLNLLRAIFRAALDAELVDANPAVDARVPRGPDTTEYDFEILTAPEVDLLLEASDEVVPLRSRAAFVVAALEGLRPGERWGLRGGDVGDGYLDVRHSRARGTKGGKPRRVPLLAPAALVLEAWRAEAPKTHPAALVWPGSGGKPFAAGHTLGWKDRPQRTRKGAPYVQLGYRWRAGIGTRVPLKDLRHTAACHLLRGTWVPRGWVARPLRMEELAQWLGHASVTTTEKHYARLAPGGLMDVVPGAFVQHEVARRPARKGKLRLL